MTTLLSDVFDIPTRAGVEDYVLRLTDSVGDRAKGALESYVVTPALAEAFDIGLSLVADALKTGYNRGAFLTGSFGSGKSHYMAVLHALLRRVPEARTIAELQPVVARHDPVLEDKNLLPLAFHFLDGDSMEQVLFDGYVKQVQALHPDAPLPAFFPSDSLLANAESYRANLGTQKFLEGLGGGGDEDEWSGVLGSAAWDEDRYHAARAAAPQSSERQALVSALVENYFPAFQQARRADYVDLDTGLQAMSSHARTLGYDGVVLFLDELVLWLAFAMHTPDFFRREAQKLTKLVEGTYGTLDTPIVSFVARQMDLRKWFADSGASGAQQEALEQAFRHQEGRFAKIELGDDNLPFVASRRLLTPVSSAAKVAVDDAFQRLDRVPKVWDVLLDGVNSDDQHRGSDERTFRLTYPFAPALVSTLRTLASVMQRDRTALKVMQQMLVDRRDSLSIEDVIPVGDCYDYVVHGNAGSALDPQVAALFRSATQLYQEKLRPLILRNNNLVESDVADAASLPRGFAADERLAKTLLLSAVAPRVPALKALTAARLASLNHGSIVSPLPGGEATVVMAKVKEWSRHVPEIRVASGSANPIISVQLADVDYESIVEKARGEDNPGRQREAIKDLIADSLRLDVSRPDAYGAYRHTITWRGSRREVELVFGNVRDAGWLTDEHFRAGAGAWRFVIDHPFDEDAHTAAEDVQRVLGLIARNSFTEQTVVWIPRFLSAERRQDLRRYVILDWLLSSDDRWTNHANHLSEADRLTAKTILQSQHSTLHEGLIKAVQQAYGASSPVAGTLQEDDGRDKVLYSLDPTFEPAPPVGATLGDAFRQLAFMAFDATYPEHPRFEPGDAEVRAVELRAVLTHLERAAGNPEGRVDLEGDQRVVRRVANALQVGKAAETVFLFGDGYFGSWGTEIERGLAKLGKATDDVVTVAELRSILESLEPRRGLRPEVADLVILGWGLLRQRAWFQHGGAIALPVPGSVQSVMELRPQAMPSRDDWASARLIAASILTESSQQYMTPVSVAKLASGVRAAAASRSQPAHGLVSALEESAARLGTDGGARLRLARALADLLDALRQQDGVPLIERLARVELPGTPEEAGRSLAQAQSLTDALNAFPWDRFKVLAEAAQKDGERSDHAQRILDDLGAELGQHELATAGKRALQTAEQRLFDWLIVPAPVEPVDPPRPPRPPADYGSGRAAGDGLVGVRKDLDAFLDKNAGRTIKITWEVVE